MLVALPFEGRDEVLQAGQHESREFVIDGGCQCDRPAVEVVSGMPREHPELGPTALGRPQKTEQGVCRPYCKRSPVSLTPPIYSPLGSFSRTLHSLGWTLDCRAMKRSQRGHLPSNSCFPSKT